MTKVGGIRKIMFLWQAVFLVASRDGSAVKSQSTILQRLRRQISLDYYTIPPVTQASAFIDVLQTLQTSQLDHGQICFSSVSHLQEYIFVYGLLRLKTGFAGDKMVCEYI